MTANPKSENRNYLAGIAVAACMLRSGVIDADDYSALEAAFAAKFSPLFRYESLAFPPRFL